MPPYEMSLADLREHRDTCPTRTCTNRQAAWALETALAYFIEADLTTVAILQTYEN